GNTAADAPAIDPLFQEGAPNTHAAGLAVVAISGSGALLERRQRRDARQRVDPANPDHLAAGRNLVASRCLGSALDQPLAAMGVAGQRETMSDEPASPNLLLLALRQFAGLLSPCLRHRVLLCMSAGQLYA